MKVYLPFLLTVLLSSCVKIDARDNSNNPPLGESKADYVCDCTYISMGSDPKKEEATKLTNRTKAEANTDCAGLEAKYIMQSYAGTCVIK